MDEKKNEKDLNEKIKEYSKVYGGSKQSAIPQKRGFTTNAVEWFGFPPMQTEEELRWAHTCTMSSIHRILVGSIIGGGIFLATARSAKIQNTLKFRHENGKWPNPTIITAVMTSLMGILGGFAGLQLGINKCLRDARQLPGQMGDLARYHTRDRTVVDQSEKYEKMIPIDKPPMGLENVIIPEKDPKQEPPKKQ